MKWRILGGFGVALAVIVALVWFVGWNEVLDIVRATDRPVFALAFVFSALAILFRILVWVNLLGILDHGVPARKIGAIFLSAKFLKYITPYGQLAATPGIAWFVSSFTDEEYEHNLAAIMGADLFTYSPYYTFGLVGLAYVSLGAAPFPNVGVYLIGAAVIVLILCLVGWLILFKRHVTENLVVWVLSPVGRGLSRIGIGLGEELHPNRLRNRIEGFYDTVDRLLDDRKTLRAGLLFGHAAWFCLMLPIVVTAWALGIELSIFLAMLVVALSKLGFLVPLPGGLGGVELTIAGLLFLIAGIGMAHATAIALLYRLATYWFTVLLGGIAAGIIIATWPGRGGMFRG